MQTWTNKEKRKLPYWNWFMIGELEVKVVGLDQLKFVNNSVKQQLTNAL